jgi:hypothetical protein
MTVECKGGQSWFHVLATSAGDRLTARELMVFGVLDFDLRICLGIFSWFVLTGRAIVKLSRSSESERRANSR